MAYLETSNYHIKYPTPDEEMNIPEDLQILAETTDTAMVNLVNNNLITAAFATIASPAQPADFCDADVVNGVLTLVFPRVISDPNKLGTSGNQTLNGTLSVSGRITTGATPSGATDVVTKSYADTKMPIGGIIAWSGNPTTVPAGWQLCDGSTHTSSALFETTGSSTTPDLRDRFIIGASSTKPKGASAGGVAGQATLTVNELPAHGHTASQETYSHVHTATTNSTTKSLTSHTHPVPTISVVNLNHDHDGVALAGGAHAVLGYLGDIIRYGADMSGGSRAYVAQQNAHAGDLLPDIPAHTHTLDVKQLTTANAGATAILSHTHTLTNQASTLQPDLTHEHNLTTPSVTHTHQHTIGSTGNGQPFSILPPYYAFAYIIYKGL